MTMNKRNFRRCVVKLGSRILVPQDRLDEIFIRALAEQICKAHQTGCQVVLVTSGAIATGMRDLNLNERPRSIERKQAVAAVGQIRLMETYRRAFEDTGLKVAQILLTHEDFRDRKRFLNARHTIQALIEMGVVPLINENDSIASEEIKVGDNDNLAGMVACLWEADLLMLLTDIDGLYTADPREDPSAKLIPVVEELHGEIEAFAAATTNPTAVGGMRTKIEAAKRAAGYQIPTVIAQGRTPLILERLLKGEQIGTWIEPVKGERLNARKHWIRFVLKPQGRLHIDDGAFRAITEQGKSLLPSGIVSFEGQFEMGDAVELVDARAKSFACGVVSYSSQELSRIRGCQTRDIESILGYRYRDEVIHRDDLVLFL